MSIQRMTRAELIETARGIVTNQLMIADPSRHEWRASLALILSEVHKDKDPQRLGIILVPVAPHQGRRWINGIAPGCTMECRIVHVNDHKRLGEEIDRMAAALYPEPATP